jgi:uncharacterized membrane protein YhaH (DUF805 family)
MLHIRNSKTTAGGNMKFGEAVSSAFSNYATFKGRTRRSGYWFFYLVWVLVTLVASIMDTVLFGTPFLGYGLIYSVAGLALFLPNLAVSVRRMHDVDKSGWFILVPIYNIVLLCTDSTPGANRFGGATK